MAKLIFISPYIKGGSNSGKVSNLVNYIATREGVQLSPSPDRRENFVDYIANRPGVKRVSSNGLWDGEGQVPILKRVVDEVSAQEGNIWTPVISLPRQDAERLGYDNVDSWRHLICSLQNDIAEAYKIKPDNLKWYAALHEKEKHIHVHMIIFSSDPNEGYLTKQGIANLKSSLVRQIYKDELLNIYNEQTQRRDALQENAKELMRDLIGQMEQGDLNNPKLETLIRELVSRLQNYSGKKVYGYMPPATKRIVDEIVDELARDTRVAEAYSLWQDMRDEVFAYYSRTKPKRVPLSQQKEFKPVRNMVIRKAVQLMEGRKASDLKENTETKSKDYVNRLIELESQKTQDNVRQKVLPHESVTTCAVRMLHHMGNIFREQTNTQMFYRGLQLDKKRRKELQAWKIAIGHRADDHEEAGNYPKAEY